MDLRYTKATESDLLILTVGLTGECAFGLLADHLDGHLVEVLGPEPESDLATDPGAQQLADGVLGGEGLGEGLLHNVRTHEDEHLLGWVGETDGGVVIQWDGCSPAHFGPIDPGTFT